jgi:hypothetical protein
VRAVSLMVRFRGRVACGGVDSDHFSRLCAMIGGGHCVAGRVDVADLVWRGEAEERDERGRGKLVERGIRGGWGSEEERMGSTNVVKSVQTEGKGGEWVTIDDPKHGSSIDFSAFESRFDELRA